MAWEELYDHYAPCLYGVILRSVPAEIAASVLKDTFIAVYDHIHEYQADGERFFTWMYKLTLCSCALAKNGTNGIANLSSSPSSPSLPSLPAFSQMANG